MTKSKTPVKRGYSSPLREEHASATRSAIVDAAAGLFGELGFAAVSIDAIAARAGVSRATVFTVGGKAELLKEAYAAAFGHAAGDRHLAMPLVERPKSREVRSRPTVDGYLDGYAAINTQINRHLAPLHEALREAARDRPELAALYDKVLDDRRRGAATIVADVKERAPLHDGIDEVAAADAVWALMDPLWFHLLVRRRGWTEDRFRDWIATTLRAQLVRK